MTGTTDTPSADELAGEYTRPPAYGRPLGGIVRVMDRLIRQGMTQTDALKNDDLKETGK